MLLVNRQTFQREGTGLTIQLWQPKTTSTTVTSTSDPWSIYWQADNLDSCVTSWSIRDTEAISQLWQDFAAGLDADAKVLDLATGNGTVPLALLQGNDSLRITAVDKADIDPQRFLSSPGPLREVDFVGDTDICSLPYDAGSFDAVTSQFGIEYAPLNEAIGPVVSVLKTGGKLSFLMHHADSDVVKPARLKICEMAGLLQPKGLISCLLDFVGGGTDAGELESAGQRHLESGSGRSSQISGQIFEGVNRVMQCWQDNDKKGAAELAAVMALRLQADHDRLSQLNDAALTEEQMQSFGEQVEHAGIIVSVSQPLVIHRGTSDEALIGWELRGEKR